MAKPQLHELLAVKNQLAGQSAKLIADLKLTFEKKRHDFAESLVSYQSYEEGAQPVEEAHSKLNTTVADQLEELQKFLVQAMNVSHQINMANREAVADVTDEVTDEVIVAGVPATTLLEWEKNLVQYQGLLSTIATLDPAKDFTPDTQRGKGIYKAREVVTVRKQKKKEKLVLFEPTPTQPGQAQVYDVDVPTGTIHTQEWSGLISPKQKTAVLAQCEKMLREVRQARSRANKVEVDTKNRPAETILRRVFTIPE